MTPERWQKITGMFHAALARPAEQRARFVNDACFCGPCAPSRGRGHARRACKALAALRMCHPWRCRSAVHEFESGQTIGPYTIEGLIGAGGMGRVYRGRDSRIGREVAIKVLPADYAGDTDRLRRFEQEARASGALTHPNVLTLYDVGTADGRPYLITELARRRNAARSNRPRHHSAGAGVRSGRGDCTRTCGGARERHHPPRPEARECDAHA